MEISNDLNSFFYQVSAQVAARISGDTLGRFFYVALPSHDLNRLLQIAILPRAFSVSFATWCHLSFAISRFVLYIVFHARTML